MDWINEFLISMLIAIALLVLVYWISQNPN
jgi:hypothetical protein